MTQEHKSLPDKLSAVVRLAVQDLTAIENNPNYVINMNYYHLPAGFPGSDNKCSVCFAGAVMANSLGADRLDTKVPAEYDDETGRRLAALDRIRRYSVDTALFIYFNAANDWSSETNRSNPVTNINTRPTPSSPLQSKYGLQK